MTIINNHREALVPRDSWADLRAATHPIRCLDYMALARDVGLLARGGLVPLTLWPRLKRLADKKARAQHR